MNTILVTGSAGFIGANLVLRLLEGEEPVHIIGLDNLNDYYDPALERDFGFTPGIYLRQGLRKFAEWYKWYYMEGGCPSVGKVS